MRLTEDRNVTIVDGVKPPVTPSAFRAAQKGLKEAETEYRAARKKALAVRKNGRLAREDAIGAWVMARHWLRTMRDRVWDMAERVEVGAAWSPKGLDNVRRANKRRNS